MKKTKYRWITFGFIAFLVFFSGWKAPLQARPKKTDKYPPETLSDTPPNPPFYLHPPLALERSRPRETGSTSAPQS